MNAPWKIFCCRNAKNSFVEKIVNFKDKRDKKNIF